MKRYEYAAMPLGEVLALMSASLCSGPGAFLADDEASRAYKGLLERGFRFLRSEEGMAVFEREVDGD